TILSIAETDAQLFTINLNSFNNNSAGNNSLNNNGNSMQRFNIVGGNQRGNQSTSAPQTTSNLWLQLIELFSRGLSQVPVSQFFPQYGPSYSYY
ncbi:hypothetical protein LOAG_14951, partial [Loa loa]